MKKEKIINEQYILQLEMAKEIHKALLDCNNESCRNCEFQNDTPLSFCKAEYIARTLSQKYQLKIPEDSIIISKSDYDKLKSENKHLENENFRLIGIDIGCLTN